MVIEDSGLANAFLKDTERYVKRLKDVRRKSGVRRGRDRRGWNAALNTKPDHETFAESFFSKVNLYVPISKHRILPTPLMIPMSVGKRIFH